MSLRAKIITERDMLRTVTVFVKIEERHIDMVVGDRSRENNPAFHAFVEQFDQNKIHQWDYGTSLSKEINKYIKDNKFHCGRYAINVLWEHRKALP